ncbi:MULTISPECIES: hypothetical protein [unclassified Microcoleus]|uniref:hypothetical protein n=1 Tax=unclassified Microcoleus TaxID=2642155 RepID=UPI002FD25899
MFLNKACAMLQSELAGANKRSTKGEAIRDRVTIRCIPQKYRWRSLKDEAGI